MPRPLSEMLVSFDFACCPGFVKPQESCCGIYPLFRWSMKPIRANGQWGSLIYLTTRLPRQCGSLVLMELSPLRKEFEPIPYDAKW